jgi:hypothetical protein
MFFLDNAENFGLYRNQLISQETITLGRHARVFGSNLQSKITKETKCHPIPKRIFFAAVSLIKRAMVRAIDPENT